jgi:flagellar biosynthesis/type III secretory pathway M-ring protein FliF/YscJ
VAKKRKRKIGWLGKFLLLIGTPIIIWLLAFLIWFYWNDLTKSFTANKGKAQPAPKATRQADPPAKKSADEKIFDEDREKLDEILNKKSR